MASEKLLAALIAAPGTSRADRDAPERGLDPARAPLDGRDAADLLRAARALAGSLHHYATDPGQPSGDWTGFFPAQGAGEGDAAYRARLAALVESDAGDVPPHLALLAAFLRAARHPRRLLDDFTRRHLDFQVRTALGFVLRPAEPDRAHVLVGLKKGAAPLEVGTELRLSAGKDAAGRELLYRPVRPVVVNHAAVAGLCTVARSEDGVLSFAPAAASANGLGEPLPPDRPDWHPFGLRRAGEAPLPEAPVGFALASGVLRLAEGLRRVAVELDLEALPDDATPEVLAEAFEARLTGPKGWLGPYPLEASAVTGATWAFRVTVAADQPAVADASPAVHEQPFPAGTPVLQLLLREGQGACYGLLAGVTLRDARVSVDVSGIRGLRLESDFGVLDPKKAFLPFGPAPARGARFYVGCAEALGKRLTALSLDVSWQGAPATQSALTALYDGYSGQGGLSAGVRATAEWSDAGGAHAGRTVDLAPAPGGRVSPDLLGGSPGRALAPRGAAAVYEVMVRSGSAAARREAHYQRRRRPLASAVSVSERRPGFVTLTLSTDLLHGAWRTEAVAALLAADPKTLGEPWTPKVQELSLSYAAEAGPARLGEDTAEGLAAGVEVFHVDAFGCAREHPWLTARRPWAARGPVSLLPRHDAAGELYVGLSGVGAGDPVSLLFQVSEGSADPRARAQTAEWSVLADNAWRPLEPGRELFLDTTRSLRASGVVSAVLPAETTADNTLMPAGPLWLRAAVPAQPGAACRLVGVHANAVELVFDGESGSGGGHLATALPAGRLARFTAPPAGIKDVSQPYASFGGAPAEDAAALARRAAERVRHRNRAVTAWDFEHLVLAAFPGVDRVKCIPHSREGSWLAPGHTTLVVVPDLRNRNAADPLRPRVDLDTLERIKAHVLARGPLGLDEETLTVKNPSYRAVRADFKVSLRPGFAFSYYRAQLNEALVRALSPWAFDGTRRLDFGGRVVRSALVDFVEELPWVDYVTDFRLTLADAPGEDLPELAPDAPDAILVSAPEHAIAEVT